MKYLIIIFLLISPVVCGAFIVNGNFEAGDLSGWTVSFGVGSGQSATVVSTGVVANTNGNLSRLYQGIFSAELVSGTGGGSHAAFARIEQTGVIDPVNTVLEFNYAAALDGAHALGNPLDAAYFKVEVLAGLTNISTSYYSYASSPAPLVDDGVLNWKHLPWTNLTIDLSAYVGVTVTVRFSAHNCGPAGHRALAYIDGFTFVTPTFTPTYSPTVTPTFTASQTFTNSPTFTATRTYSPTSTATPTYTVTPTITQTRTPTYTPTFTATPTHSPTYTVTPNPLIAHLYSPNPNPSDGSGTWIPFWLSVEANVVVKVFTVAGELVRTLPAKFYYRGNQEQFWDNMNEAFRGVASGIFILKLEATTAAGEYEDLWGKCAVAR